MRGILAEYGIVAAKGISRLRDLLPVLDAGAGVPARALARQTLLLIAQLIEALTMQIRKIETELLAWHRTNPDSQRLETIPGSGLSPPRRWPPPFSMRRRSDRDPVQFAAWLRVGTAAELQRPGKERLGGISKMGDRYLLRHLLVVGATAVVRYTRRKATTISIWANRLLDRQSLPGWSLSRSPTRWLGSRGPSWRGRRIIALPPPPREASSNPLVTTALGRRERRA